MSINVVKLSRELIAAGIPISGVVDTKPPRIDFLPEATADQQQQAQQILSAHVPEDNADKRERAYLEQGVTSEAMIAALWEQIVEGKPDKVQAIQKIRGEIKKAFPIDPI